MEEQRTRSQDISAQSPIVKSSQELSVFCCEECGKVKLRPRQSGTTCARCKEGISSAQLMQSQAVGLARITALRVISRAWKAKKARYSKKSLELLASYNQQYYIWKMSQGSLLPGLVPYSVSWPRRGLMLSGDVYLPPQWELHTLESGYGYWPTPTATEYGSNQSDSDGAAIRESLQTIARRFYPTPTAIDANGRLYQNQKNGSRTECLPGLAKRFYPTQSASEADHGSPARSYGDGSPTLSSLAAKIGPGRSLSPLFVAALMGLPIDALELEPEAEAGFHTRRARHSKD